jgi:hypothetical protein
MKARLFTLFERPEKGSLQTIHAMNKEFFHPSELRFHP